CGVVWGGGLGRRGGGVSVSCPGGVGGKSIAGCEIGKTTALQIEAGQASFVLTDLKAGKTKQYRIVPSSAFDMRVTATTDERLLRVTSGAGKIFDFRLQRELPEPGIKEAFKRAGYIHPVYSPSGRVVTDDYPSDHYHQHGIMFAWTKTEFEGRQPDFWNMGNGSGSVE